MVGVPGRSKACQPCKQRRTACDLKQPECSRCVKAKRPCTYRQRHIFVLNDEGSHKTVYRKRDAADHDGEHQEVSSRGDPSEPLALWKAPSPGAVTREALLANAISEDHSGLGSPFTKLIASSITTGIFETLYMAPLACYALWRGRRDSNPSLVEASHQLYVRGLIQTQKAVMNPLTARADSTLATCNALGLYEALECPDRNMAGYLWHRDACCRLLRLRGPELHRDGAAHTLFTSFRLYAVLQAFEQGEPCEFSTPEWMTVPWEIQPKTSLDEIVDIFMAGPEIVRQSRRLETLPPNQMLGAALEIAKAIFDAEQRLQDFYRRLEQRYPKPLYWELMSPTREDAFPPEDPQSDDLIFSPALYFHDLDLATVLNLHWAFLALTWSGLLGLSELFQQFGVTQEVMEAVSGREGLTPETIENQWLDNVRKVFQSLAFCTTTEALESGPPRLGTAFNLVVGTLKDHKNHRQLYDWAVRARNLFGAKWVRLFNYTPPS